MLTAPLPVPPAPLAIETPPPLAEAEDPALKRQRAPSTAAADSDANVTSRTRLGIARTQHQGTRRSARRGPRPTTNTPVTSNTLAHAGAECRHQPLDEARAEMARSLASGGGRSRRH